MFLSNYLNEEPVVVFYLEGWRVLVLAAGVEAGICIAIYRNDYEDEAAEEDLSTSYLWLIIGEDIAN